MLLKKRPLHLTLFVTNRCNALCRFCFYETNRPVEELKLEEYRLLAENLQDLLWLSFSGGEVFLREDLADIARVFYEMCRPSFVLISTNGSLPERVYEQTEKVLMDCPGTIVVLKVSIDGVGPKHDRIRGIDGAFDRALRTLKLLGMLRNRFSNLQIGVNTVLCKENIDNIDETIEYVKSIPEVQVHTLSLVRGRAYGTYGIDAAGYGQKIRSLYQRSTKTCYGFSGARLKAAQDRLQSNFIEMVLRGEKLPLRCTAGRLSLVVTETGEVYPCEAFHLSFGQLRDYGFDLNRLLEENKDNIKRLSVCQCTHECNLMLNILSSFRAYPSLLRHYLVL